MLNPEVWNFKAPESSFTVTKGDCISTNLIEKINKFHYNHLVSLVLPDTFRVPEYLSNVLTADCDYYKVVNLNVNEFANIDFIENFIKKGSLIALSVNTRIDCDDCVCLKPDGLLVLSLNKDTYQCLGLEGKVSHFTHKTKSRYIVTVDLKSKLLQPKKPSYEKLKTRLGKLKKTDFIISWEPHRDDICPSSVAKYFCDLNYGVKLCSPKCNTVTEYSVQVPSLFENLNSDDALELVEWLGMLCLGCDLESGSPDNYVNTYEAPEPKSTIGQVKILQWRGFYNKQHIERLYESLKKFLDSEEKQWASLYVQGYSDAPTVMGNQEHHFYTNGDNSYLLLLNSSQYLSCNFNCSNKQYK